MDKTPRTAVERVARIYHSNEDASRALGIAMRTFGRLCREYGIETPYKRKLRRRSRVSDKSVLHESASHESIDGALALDDLIREETL